MFMKGAMESRHGTNTIPLRSIRFANNAAMENGVLEHEVPSLKAGAGPVKVNVREERLMVRDETLMTRDDTLVARDEENYSVLGRKKSGDSGLKATLSDY